MDKKISITLKDKVGRSFDFETLKQLRQFIKRELSYWQKKQDKFTDPKGQLTTYLSAVTYFQQIENTIDSWENSLDKWNEQQLQQQVNHNNIRQAVSQLANRWLWQGHPFIEPWLGIGEKYGSVTGDIFINSFANNGQLGGISTKDQLKGAVLAYEFDLQDENDLTRRRNAEKKSISKVRSDLISAKDELYKDVAEFQDDFHQWDEINRFDAEKLYRVRKKLGERQIRQQGVSYDSHLGSWTESFNGQYDEWIDKISDLEETYREKLRLEQPATYWKKKAVEYSKGGSFWILMLVIVVTFGILGFGFLFWEWLQSQEIPIKLNSLQGVVLFVTIVSSYAFIIKVFSRLAFSSFHLQRDVEEREQLTHVYLALTHENDSMDEAARNIILQALFSRADTGLLRGDSSPTMPSVSDTLRAATSRQS